MRIRQLDFIECSNYIVREDGCVVNIKHVRKVTGELSHGYVRVTLQADDGTTKRVLVHRLVAMAFLPKVEGKRYVNHIDSCGANNDVTNLEWCTSQENSQHMVAVGRRGGNKKLTDEQIVYIQQSKLGSTLLARELGVSKQAVLYWRNKSVFVKEA